MDVLVARSQQGGREVEGTSNKGFWAEPGSEEGRSGRGREGHVVETGGGKEGRRKGLGCPMGRAVLRVYS